MNARKFYFSTPMVNKGCPFGLKNPCVAITEQAAWGRAKTFEECHELSRWMKKQGFGEITSSIYQVDTPKLMTCNAVKDFLESKGMIHNDALDVVLIQTFEL